MDKHVRLACFIRSNSFCECGCGMWGGERLQADHFWGRRHSETRESVWMLLPEHHQWKTDNKPSRKEWLWLFRQHCERHEYWEQVAKVDQALDWYDLKHGAA